MRTPSRIPDYSPVAAELDKSVPLVFDSSLYIRSFPIPIWGCAFNSANAPTQVLPAAPSVGGWLMGNNLVNLYGNSHVFDDWDGVSNPWIEMTGECRKDNSGGADTDFTRVDLTFKYKKAGDVGYKMQGSYTPFVFGKSIIGASLTEKIELDFDKADNVLTVGCDVVFYFNVNTTASDINDFMVNELIFRYNTAKINPSA